MSINQPFAARVLSVDILRGLTIAAMIVVNNPGSWSATYAPLRHAAWDGLTPTDLVFPFFLFVMGVSTYFSLVKTGVRYSDKLMGKISRRAVVLFLIGVALGVVLELIWSLASSGTWAFDPGHIRILGVLQRLAICSWVGSLLALWVPKRWWLTTALALLVVYSWVLWSTDSLSLSAGNVVGRVDAWLLGASHLYTERLADGTLLAFDPEGLLSTVPAVAQTLLGVLVGSWIADGRRSAKNKANTLLIFGGVVLLAGLLLDYGGLPINKKLWSFSFVLATTGYATLLLGLLLWVVDIKGWGKGLGWARNMGTNPLLLYIVGAVLGTILAAVRVGEWSLREWVVEGWAAIGAGPYLASLLYALTVAGLCALLGWWLYRKQIVVKL